MCTNPYVNQIAQQTGMSEREVRQSARKAEPKVYPMTIGGRTYNSEAEYLDDLHDFLNGC